ncbi:MAG: hypothetical protein R3237_03320 [Nitrosopumilaceae archaeon]|nr:hypothetical protein [Nitrosopumilaceae archaeon]
MRGKKITTVIDDDLIEELRKIQSKLSLESSTHVSFSKVINDQIRKTLK